MGTFIIFGISLYLVFLFRHVTQHHSYMPQEGAPLVSISGLASHAARLMFIAFNFVQTLATKPVRFCLFNLSSLFGAIACGAILLVHEFSMLAGVCGVIGCMHDLQVGALMNVMMP